MPAKRNEGQQIRYGIGEWYGKSFVGLSQAERVRYSTLRTPVSEPCIPRSTPERIVPCSKRGGVCSLRLYRRDLQSEDIQVISGPGTFATLCPHRLKENHNIYHWVGERILIRENPLVVNEIGFLLKASRESDNRGEISGLEDEAAKEDVGKIDSVLVDRDLSELKWCALELQAVYFSGPSMTDEFTEIRGYSGDRYPFPVHVRRPDYRSSGPKRLMPQLMIKVPALRRWGKKMAVGVDRSFFDALGTMDQVPEISNSDIIWFVLDYQEINGEFRLNVDRVQYTTLERAIEGLTAGKPISLPVFEQRIREKIKGTGENPDL